VAKVSERTNRNLPARNTLVQLWSRRPTQKATVAQRYKLIQSQVGLQTVGRHNDADSGSYCVAVQ